MEHITYPEDAERSFPADRDDVTQIIDEYEQNDSPDRSDLHQMTTDIVRRISNDLGTPLEGELNKAKNEHGESITVKMGRDVHKLHEHGEREYSPKDKEVASFHQPINYTIEVNDVRDVSMNYDHDFEITHKFKIKREHWDDWENDICWRRLVRSYGEPAKLDQRRNKEIMEFEEKV